MTRLIPGKLYKTLNEKSWFKSNKIDSDEEHKDIEDLIDIKENECFTFIKQINDLEFEIYIFLYKDHYINDGYPPNRRRTINDDIKEISY